MDASGDVSIKQMAHVRMISVLALQLGRLAISGVMLYWGCLFLVVTISVTSFDESNQQLALIRRALNQP